MFKLIMMNKTIILVVDDSVISRQILKHQLNNNGFKVDLVSDGLSALAIMETEKFSFVLMDIVMQGIDGIETTKLIREKNIDTKIIGIGGSEEDRLASLEAGMDDYLTKPVCIDSLLKIIDNSNGGN
ncbi:response regulator [Candidatus Gracilibacteria bacterium]|nr:response regulator [Candidatus Gracilibacteria bacterium]